MRHEGSAVRYPEEYSLMSPSFLGVLKENYNGGPANCAKQSETGLTASRPFLVLRGERLGHNFDYARHSSTSWWSLAIRSAAMYAAAIAERSDFIEFPGDRLRKVVFVERVFKLITAISRTRSNAFKSMIPFGHRPGNRASDLNGCYVGAACIIYPLEI